MAVTPWSEVDRLLHEALALPQEQRSAYLDANCAGRADLAAELTSLLAEQDRPGPLDILDPLDAEADDDAALAGRRLGPYRLIREIGRGGMGSVWLAERADRQFEKRVAIKLLSAGLPASEALRRFRDERQILASLEHPNIARLLDAGRSDEGLHYIVMEYVDGAPITAHCDDRALDVRARVALLRTIASTVHFAHQRLVVHRDLKPANILVTSDGEPRLLDFGVAKVLAPDAAGDATVPLLHLATPAYASPEQLRGQPATTSSDVYSLGVLAFQLVTGSLPDRRKGPEAHGAADPDLDAILVKATRDNADDRYASAEDLADDLSRFLARHPVTARQATTSYRLRKFAARHRAGVAASAAALVLFIAGVAAIVWQAGVARRERAIAESRFDDVRQLARAMIFDVYDRIATLPGSTAARQAVVSEALRYLDRVSREQAVPRDLGLELAQAYVRIGQVQFNSNIGNLGDTDGALASYATARRILEDQLRRAPSDVELRRLTARAHGLSAEVFLYLRRVDEGRSSIEAALGIRKALAASGAAEDRRGLASAYFQLGAALDSQDDRASVVAKRQALDIFEALLAANPADSDAQRNVALTCKTLGASLSNLNELDEAERQFQRALALDEARVAAEPGSAMARMDLSFDLSSMALLLHRRKNPESLRYWERTIEIRRQLASADAKDARARGRLAYALIKSGSARAAFGDRSGALEHFHEAVTLADHLLSLNRNDGLALSYAAEAWMDISYAEQALAGSAAAAGQRAAHRRRSCEAAMAARGHYRQNVANGTATTTDRRDLEAAEKMLEACGPVRGPGAG